MPPLLKNINDVDFVVRGNLNKSLNRRGGDTLLDSFVGEIEGMLQS